MPRSYFNKNNVPIHHYWHIYQCCGNGWFAPSATTKTANVWFCRQPSINLMHIVFYTYIVSRILRAKWHNSDIIILSHYIRDFVQPHTAYEKKKMENAPKEIVFGRPFSRQASSNQLITIWNMQCTRRNQIFIWKEMNNCVLNGHVQIFIIAH